MEKQTKKTKKRYRHQYAVKFICTSNIPGTSQTTDALLPGAYQTAVNIHNPWEKEVKIRKKLASTIHISKYLEGELKPDGVERVVCSQISDFEVQLIHGFEGFLVIESDRRLDVVAVYTTAENGGQVVSLDVEYIKGRKI